MLNELKGMKLFKKSVQTLTYMPHFLSWAFVAAFLITFFSESGVINYVLTSLNVVSEPYAFLADRVSFFSIVVLSDIWKFFGFSSIIYLAAISTISPTLYEAAYMDGASRFQRAWYITIPGIKPTVIILLILSISRMMTQNFEQLFLMQNILVLGCGGNSGDVYLQDGITEGQVFLFDRRRSISIIGGICFAILGKQVFEVVYW